MRLFIRILAILLILSACSTKKNTMTRRAYHNLTAHFNAYYNGNEALKDGVLTLEGAHKDNYSLVIDIFPFGSDKEVQTVTPQMERAIEKAMKVIKKHSMTFKGVEYVKWIDDSYLMIGKARFYKRDYPGAVEIFELVANNYNSNPIKTDAEVWNALTNIYTGNLRKAGNLLVSAGNGVEKNFVTKEGKRLFPMVKALYEIKSGLLEESLVTLDDALKLNKRKKTNVRLMFVKAQVLQKLGRNAEAMACYEKIIKRNPQYEIAFHSKIFAAQCFDAGSGSSTGIVKELTKMVKEKKNEDYFDEIYFALANIALKEKQEAEGIKYLQLSGYYSKNNNFQKATTYLTLGDIFFEKKEYVLSQGYYDTAMSVIPKTYPNYDKLKDRHKVLSDLVKNLNTVELEDSLQHLASLNENARNAAIDKLIAQYIKNEELKKQQELERQRAANAAAANMNNIASTNSNWYFYNSSTVSFGRSEFAKKWGQRQLEDLWRLSNKQEVDFNNIDVVEENVENPEDTVAGSKNPKNRNYYLKDIPLTPEKLKKSDEKIKSALFALAQIYSAYLEEYKNAVDAVETLNKRYPENDNELESYYIAYSSAKKIMNGPMIDKYKNLIITKFPNSDYAKGIADPDYFNKIAQQKGVAEDYYERLYDNYILKNYKLVVDSALIATKRFKDPEILAKSDFLAALSLSKTYKIDTLVPLLNTLIKNYPQSSVKPLAENILASFEKPQDVSDKGQNNKTDGSANKSATTYHLAKDDDIHLLMLVYNSKKLQTQKIKNAISDFNLQNYPNEKLTVNTLFISDVRIMLTISYFKQKVDAMNYYKLLQTNNTINQLIASGESNLSVISSINYPIFYKSKNEKEYMDFFSKNYLGR